MNKKTFGAVVFLLALFNACDMTGSKSEWSSDGKAVVRVLIAGLQGRTVTPEVALQDVTEWALLGGTQGETETELARFTSAADASVSIDSGTWNFTLIGYKESAAILKGSVTGQYISSSAMNALNFTVAPIEDDGEGTLSITIELPAGSGITEARVFKDGQLDMTVYPVDDKVVVEGSYTAGAYYFSVRLYKGEDVYGTVSEAVYIWANLSSENTYTLTNEDLNFTYIITYHLRDGATETGYYQYTDAAVPLPAPSLSYQDYAFKGWYEDASYSGSAVSAIPTGSMGNKDFYAKWGAVTQTPSYLSLAESLAWISANAVEDGAYGITINADESLAPQTLSYNGANVSIALDGGYTERTVSLSTTGALFDIYSGVTLTLGNNVTLQGRSDNTTSLVHVNSAGALVMNAGSKITGNTTSFSYVNYGGGVYVDGGTFTMSGGEISGNTGFSGVGVYVYSGTFTMSGGAISGNTDSGVYVYYGAFTMSGGEISGNASSSGGGVSMNGVGRFIKQSGGIIYGSNASEGLRNTATSGDSGGHAVYAGSDSKIRNTTAGVGVTLNSSVSGAAGGWETLEPISNITYSSVLGGTWTLEGDGRRKSPAIDHNGVTKARVSFTSNVSNASITIQLDASSESGYDFAFISALDNADATYQSGYYSGSVISAATTVTITIPVPTTGDHFIDIGYCKDGSVSNGSDCAWFKILQ
jgi:uncharacterized repeat protein (TIGR02543 family)